MSTDTLNVLIDTTDDGNCFYSAVYGAAKFHPVAGTLAKLLNCMFRGNSPNGNVQDIGERDFIAAFREEVARRIRGRVLEEKAATEEEPNIYDYLREQAEQVVMASIAGLNNANVEDYPFILTMGDASTEISDEFGDAAAFMDLTKAEFKKRLAAIVATDTVFVSEIDFNIIKFILRRCGILLEVIDPETGHFTYVRDGRPVLLLHRIAAMEGAEHYQYFTTYDRYKQNADVVMGAKTVRKKPVAVQLADRIEVRKKHTTTKTGPKISEPITYRSGQGAVISPAVAANVKAAVNAVKAANKPKSNTTKNTKPAATKTRKQPTRLMSLAMMPSNSNSNSN